MVFTIVAPVVVGVTLVCVLAIALASAAGWADAQRVAQGRSLSMLSGLRSPSGRPFFANPGAVPDFIHALEDLCEELADPARVERGRSGGWRRPFSRR